jgi:hypothetical protein
MILFNRPSNGDPYPLPLTPGRNKLSLIFLAQKVRYRIKNKYFSKLLTNEKRRKKLNGKVCLRICAKESVAR